MQKGNSKVGIRCQIKIDLCGLQTISNATKTLTLVTLLTFGYSFGCHTQFFSMVILHVCSQSPTFLLSAQSKQEFTVEGEWEGVVGGGGALTLYLDQQNV